MSDRAKPTADLAILILGYNRPTAMEKILLGFKRALISTNAEGMDLGGTPIHVALDGPKVDETKKGGMPLSGDAEATRSVLETVEKHLPEALVLQEPRNRGLPVVILSALNRVFADARIGRVICIEDDVELAPTALTALLVTSNQLPRPHVIAAAPLRDGIPPNQCLLLTREAHEISRPLLRDYIVTFHLDAHYGQRDYAAIRAWAAELAARATLDNPSTATSQDAIRLLAWRINGIPVHALPFRLVAHRGLRGQHNTPLHALRTGILFEQLDRRSWSTLSPPLLAWANRGGGSDEARLQLLERWCSGAMRCGYQTLRRMIGRAE
ncbi:MAG: hypothetical protein ACKN9W_17760 [Methylococcus sp.]